MTTIFRENAGRQHPNERHNRSSLSAFLLFQPRLERRTFLQPHFSEFKDFICLCILHVLQPLLSSMERGDKKMPFANPQLNGGLLVRNDQF